MGSLKIKVSFAKDPYKRDLYFAKETCIFKEPVNCCHPIAVNMTQPFKEQPETDTDSRLLKNIGLFCKI